MIIRIRTKPSKPSRMTPRGRPTKSRPRIKPRSAQAMMGTMTRTVRAAAAGDAGVAAAAGAGTGMMSIRKPKTVMQMVNRLPPRAKGATS